MIRRPGANITVPGWIFATTPRPGVSPAHSQSTGRPAILAPMSDSAPVVPRFFDRHFRWRSHSVTRLEGFTDAVFAIVLALLFLRAAPAENFTELRAAMKSLLPFAVTFTIIAYVWVEHWIWSRRYDLHDRWTTFLNLLLLFLLLSYAYPLKFLFTFLTVQIFGPIGALTPSQMSVGMDALDHARLFVFYGVGYGAIFGVLALLYARALQRGAALSLSPLEVHLTRAAIVQCLAHTGVAAVSIALALLQPAPNGLPGWIYCAIGPLMAVHGTWEARGLRRHLATASS